MVSQEGESNTKKKLALVVEYEGTDYQGFQVQANAETVQGELEESLERLFKAPTRVKGASRTDAGVHARGQVVTFETRSEYPEKVYVQALNYYLPKDIRVRAAYRVPPEFDARRHAISREYEYRILNTPTPSALMRRFVCWIREPLDVEKMSEASQCLVGTHDFVSFTTPQALDKSTIRRVFRWSVEREENLVIMKAEANAYLFQQIRRTAGALVKVGTGENTIEEFKRLLEDKVCGAAGPLLSAAGLFLVRVNYPSFPTTHGVKDAKE
jgi:tRNA pseudouridine38-40 synthase